MNNKNILLFQFLNIWGSDLESFGSLKKIEKIIFSIFFLFERIKSFYKLCVPMSEARNEWNLL